LGASHELDSSQWYAASGEDNEYKIKYQKIHLNIKQTNQELLHYGGGQALM